MLFLSLYVLAGVILSPLAVLIVLLGGLIKRDWWLGAKARFGRPPAPNADRPIVVWCSSVGEVNTAVPLIRLLLEQQKSLLMLVTYTPTGYNRAIALFGDRVQVTMAPLDMLPFVVRWVERIKPRLLVLMETELWPLTLRVAKDNGAKLAMVNARLSERSFPRYRLIRFAVRPVLARMNLIGAQTDSFRKRFLSLGSVPEKTVVLGSMKFDVETTAAPEQKAKDIIRSFCENRRIVVGGSTHAGEERMLAQALVSLRKDIGDLKLILAPRHLKRVNEVARTVEELGLRIGLRSLSNSEEVRKADVLILDRIGELSWTYGLSDISFVGGSFGKRGGQNVLEPAASGVPVIVGPSTPNFQMEVEIIKEAGALLVVDKQESLVEVFRTLLVDDEKRARMGNAAKEAVAAHRGTTQRIIGELNKLLTAEEES